MTRKQFTYKEIEPELACNVKPVFNLPSYAQVDENLVNMANYFPIIEPFIDKISPGSICEIGSDLGATTKLLSEYCANNDCFLYSVDPGFSETKQINKNVFRYKSTSLKYLQNSNLADIYFIDGDHNYYTVYNELKLIYAKMEKDDETVVFLHDVGWPCGIIDMFYNKDNIPSEAERSTIESGILSLFKEEFCLEGEGLPMELVAVASNNNDKSGVLNAIQDFLTETTRSAFFKIPSIYGLGVMILYKDECSLALKHFHALRESCEKFEEFLSILEFNRIRLLEKINYSGKLWEKQQKYILKLERDKEYLMTENHRLSVNCKNGEDCE